MSISGWIVLIIVSAVLFGGLGWSVAIAVRKNKSDDTQQISDK